MTDPREIAEEILTRPGRYRSDSIALARAFLAQQPVIEDVRRHLERIVSRTRGIPLMMGVHDDACSALRALAAAPPEASDE